MSLFEHKVYDAASGTWKPKCLVYPNPQTGVIERGDNADYLNDDVLPPVDPAVPQEPYLKKIEAFVLEEFHEGKKGKQGRWEPDHLVELNEKEGTIDRVHGLPFGDYEIFG